ncbi:MAG: threonine-phosphate decarboxylase [Chlorobiaceae bacterium]|nr:threonine-phosphate decarboxylase [Chlorobiaceae bacterium]
MRGAHLLDHQHGGLPGGGEGWLDFSVNLSPLPLPLPEISIAACNPGAYPSVDGREVRVFYRERFGLDASCVMPLNGAIEGIYLLPRALGLKRVLIPQPSFFDYARACALAGGEVVGLPLDAASGFGFPDIGEVSTALQGCDALFTANPNNPTGTMFPKELVLELAGRFPKKLFIVDEAFIQFTEGFPGNSLMALAGSLENVVVVHSLTKFYALAGLRLGAVIANSGMIGRLYGHKEPWTVNAVAESVARCLLQCGPYEEAVVSLVRAGRRFIAEAIAGRPAIRLFGGSANFFLAELSPEFEPGAVAGQLAMRRLYVRDCRNFAALDGNFIRFSIRRPEENLRLVEALVEMAPTAGGSGA